MRILFTVISMCVITTMIFAYRLVENSSPEKYLKRAVKNYETQRYNEAISDLNEYLARGEDALNKTEANFYLAKSLKQTSEYEIAKKIFTSIIENTFANELIKTQSVMEYADILRLTKETDDYIMPYLEKYIKSENLSIRSDAYAFLGSQMFLKKRYNEAIPLFMMSKNETAMFSLAEVYFEMGENDRAFGIYEDIIKFYPKGKTKERAMSYYIKNIKNHADELFASKNYSYAVKYYEKLASVLEEGEMYEECIFNLAYSLYKEGRYKNALTYFEKVYSNKISLYDSDAIVYAALINLITSNYKTAYSLFQKIYEEYPTHAYAQKSMEYMEKISSLYSVN